MSQPASIIHCRGTRPEGPFPVETLVTCISMSFIYFPRPLIMSCHLINSFINQIKGNFLSFLPFVLVLPSPMNHITPRWQNRPPQVHYLNSVLFQVSLNLSAINDRLRTNEHLQFRREHGERRTILFAITVQCDYYYN